MKFALRFVALVLAVSFVTLMHAPRQAEAAQRPLQVISTFSILGDLVQNVGGDRIAHRTLIGPNGDPHTYEPTPSDARAIGGADVILEIGINFEPWLNGLYRSSRSGAVRYPVTENVPLIASPETGHRHGEWDPHVWQDVANVVAMTYTIRDVLVWLDPANAGYYSLNAAVYVQYLWQLDAWIYDYVAWIPSDRRVLVTGHNNMEYFAARYGFAVLGSAVGSISTEAEPSARNIASLANAIRAWGVPAVFPENISNPRVMQRLANEAGVALAPPLITDALTWYPNRGYTYIDMMYYNVSNMVQALSR
jgi:zinc/manganese transport system substrate-binding protein